MTLSAHDVAQQVGASLEVVEKLADLVSTGSPEAFTSHIVRKRRGDIREIVQPSRPRVQSVVALDLGVRRERIPFRAHTVDVGRS